MLEISRLKHVTSSYRENVLYYEIQCPYCHLVYDFSANPGNVFSHLCASLRNSRVFFFNGFVLAGLHAYVQTQQEEVDKRRGK